MIENYITQVEENMAEVWDRFYETQAEDGRDETITSIATAKAMIFFISQDLTELVAAEGRKKESLLSIAAALHETFIDHLARQWGMADAGEFPAPCAENIFAATKAAIPAGLRVVDRMLEATANASQGENENGAH